MQVTPPILNVDLFMAGAVIDTTEVIVNSIWDNALMGLSD